MLVAKILFSVAAIIFQFVLKFEEWQIVLSAAFLIPTSIYFVFKKTRKADILHTITLILTIAAIMLPKLRGSPAVSIMPFYLSLALSILYDLFFLSKIWYFVWAGFWGLTGFGLVQLAKDKLSNNAWIVFLAVLLIGVRDLFERRKACGGKICPLSNERDMESGEDS
ncbi:hypothetical protein Tlet_1733 [Pseudothermotoga lettingae TMO]|jgi:hypothetical protein|uniref:Uncharacterized protein n=1 Tax=Pseudothermotoga lettingae (strain ATCC BAA-301 / DSM 14385 / NBRC 107922 / TMO) TaxID=416591 RepID=A8F803_PSELT|nr:hypothetical protein Tlet_1733 [Pseudothermotoga lettingae TMO]